MLATSIILFIALRKISMGRISDIEGNTDAQNLLENQYQTNYVWTEEKIKFCSGLGVVLSMFTLIVAGSLRPSVLGGVYYLFFLAFGTWWGCYRQLYRPFAIISRLIMVFIAGHVTAFLAYQNPWPEEFLPVNSTIPRFVVFFFF